MRPVSILSNPVAEPGICGKCTSQDRDWYVDLGFDTVFNMEAGETGYPIWTEGVVYLCCDCFNSLVVDAHRSFQIFFPDVIDPRPNYTSPVGLEDVEEDEIEEVEEEVEDEEDEEIIPHTYVDTLSITVVEENNGRDNSEPIENTNGDTEQLSEMSSNSGSDSTDPVEVGGEQISTTKLLAGFTRIGT
jgi:hypothetical protein